MVRTTLVPIDRTGIAPLAISERLRGQLVHFASPREAPGAPVLGEREYYFSREDVARILDDGVLRLVSPLDTANMTEVELSDEQEAFLEWLQTNNVQRVRLEP